MLKIVHELGNLKLSKESEKISFLIANKSGSYLSLSDSENLSRYQGLFYYNKGKMNKIIESVSPDLKTTKIINNGQLIERHYDNAYEEFFMPDKKDVLLYYSENLNKIKITLDMRDVFDFDDQGRDYSIKKESGCILVSYNKKDYKMFLAISTNGLKYIKEDNWIKKEYSYDKKRNSEPNRLYVYEALTIALKKKSFICFSYSHDKDEAISKALYSLKNIKELKEHPIKPKLKIRDKEKMLAYHSCVNSINMLTHEQGIFAGLPWFFEYWSRDEAISLKSLILEDLPYKKIIHRLLKGLDDNGLMKNKYCSGSNNADGFGWLIKRISEAPLSQKQLELITARIVFPAENLADYWTKDNLALNYKKETWMDSTERKGARIEIQALRLVIYRFLYDLTKDQKYLTLVDMLKTEVIKKFWHSPILADGYEFFKADLTIRPNIFIAYYLYPSLLSKEDWELCFDNALDKLWLEWGGLSTIDKNNSYFHAEHSGEKPDSYHAGDSWYWVNNLTALCLYRLNKKKYKDYIDKIIDASVNDILYQGFIGHHSEISAASHQEAFGCWAQAWSAAMFIELMHEKNKLF
jgi:glycogen debranching enzyme